jgi:hypothetical protein
VTLGEEEGGDWSGGLTGNEWDDGSDHVCGLKSDERKKRSWYRRVEIEDCKIVSSRDISLVQEMYVERNVGVKKRTSGDIRD